MTSFHRTGLAHGELRAKFGLPPVLVREVVLQRSRAQSLQVVYGCFPPAMAELSSWGGEHLAHHA